MALRGSYAREKLDGIEALKFHGTAGAPPNGREARTGLFQRIQPLMGQKLRNSNRQQRNDRILKRKSQNSRFLKTKKRDLDYQGLTRPATSLWDDFETI